MLHASVHLSNKSNEIIYEISSFERTTDFSVLPAPSPTSKINKKKTKQTTFSQRRRQCVTDQYNVNIKVWRKINLFLLFINHSIVIYTLWIFRIQYITSYQMIRRTCVLLSYSRFIAHTEENYKHSFINHRVHLFSFLFSNIMWI